MRYQTMEYVRTCVCVFVCMPTKSCVSVSRKLGKMAPGRKLGTWEVVPLPLDDGRVVHYRFAVESARLLFTGDLAEAPVIAPTGRSISGDAFLCCLLLCCAF